MSVRKTPTIQDVTADWSKKSYATSAVQTIMVRRLKGYVHTLVRIQRHNDDPTGLSSAGWVASRRVGDEKWGYDSGRIPLKYNDNHLDRGSYPAAEGMVVSYELDELGDQAYLVVAVPNDPKEYRFNVRWCKIEPVKALMAAE